MQQDASLRPPLAETSPCTPMMRRGLGEAIAGHFGETAHALEFAPELAAADGKRFDGRTGEFLEGGEAGVVQEVLLRCRQA
jgi:hypothetical protein